MPDEGFMARWSRRKAQAKQGMPAQVAPPKPVPDGQPQSLDASPLAAAEDARAQPRGNAPASPRPPLPTLDDVAHLTPESDFHRFVAPTVDPAVKNAALKKLFADPHFNVMDGLDVYIDDYTQPSPIPAAVLRELVQARGLGLFDPGAAQDQASPDGAAPIPPQQSAPEVPAVPPDENPDLRLQQDDAAGCGGAEERPPA
jgi:hypothetical protein